MPIVLPLPLLLSGCFDPDPEPWSFTDFVNAPKVAILSPRRDTTFGTEEAVELAAEVLDDDGRDDIVRVVWTSDLEGDLAPPAATKPDAYGISRLTLPLSSGNHTITVEALDKQEHRVTASVKLTVLDDALLPKARIVQPDPFDRVLMGDPVALDGDASSEVFGTDALRVTWSVERDLTGESAVVAQGAPEEDGRTRTTWTPDLVGSWSILLEVEDPDGVVDLDEVQVEVLDPDDADLDGDGVTPREGDCDDDAIDVHEGAPELPDGIDNDCDGLVDEGTPRDDLDGDGYCASDVDCEEEGVLPGDCDETSRAVNPGEGEVCNTRDDDCDGDVDEQDAIGCIQRYEDVDDDTFGAEVDPRCLCDDEGDWTAIITGDCDDTDPAIHPLADELPDDVDQDCDDRIDEGTVRDDLDRDGYCPDPVSCADPAVLPGDCDDGDHWSNPGARERCFDLVDQDCDGSLNGLDGIGCVDYAADLDGDGWGNPDDRRCYCEPTGDYGFITGIGDCDDADPAVHPGQQGYFDRPSVSGTWDYDCNDQINHELSTLVYACDWDLDWTDYCLVDQVGWVGPRAPDCGESDDWAEGCTAGLFTDCSPETLTPLQQRCR